MHEFKRELASRINLHSHPPLAFATSRIFAYLLSPDAVGLGGAVVVVLLGLLLLRVAPPPAALAPGSGALALGSALVSGASSSSSSSSSSVSSSFSSSVSTSSAVGQWAST